jgi:hypothetical protein
MSKRYFGDAIQRGIDGVARPIGMASEADASGSECIWSARRHLPNSISHLGTLRAVMGQLQPINSVDFLQAETLRRASAHVIRDRFGLLA